MNKKITKRAFLITAVWSLSLLLVSAIVLTATGAWYTASKNAYGTLSFANGVVIKINNVVQGTGENASMLFLQDSSNTSLEDYTIAPGQTIALTNPSIVADDTTITSSNFYLRAKLVVDDNDTVLTGAGLSALFSTIPNFDGSKWTADVSGYETGWYYLYSGGAFTEMQATSAAVNAFGDGNTSFVVNANLDEEAIAGYTAITVTLAVEAVQSAGGGEDLWASA